MEYQETGRFGRITKNLRRKGFEGQLDSIVHDSKDFPGLKKPEQTEYLETVMDRMVEQLGRENTDSVLFACGEQCCGKSWSEFAKGIMARNIGSVDDFIAKLNIEEKKYDTYMTYDAAHGEIAVFRKSCICGLINKGKPFRSNKSFCNCSLGHMSFFFRSVLEVKEITLLRTIMNGDDRCEWRVKLAE